jgi:hypothetical protein
MKLTINYFQVWAGGWIKRCFGTEQFSNVQLRAFRAFEEFTELAQCAKMTEEQAHAIVKHVYGRPVGEPANEIAGSMIGVAGIAEAMGIDMQDALNHEIERCETRIELIREKNLRKPDFSVVA